MHGEPISRWVNQLDGSLLRCLVHALLTTLSFVHVTCAHIWKRMQNVFHCCMKMSMGFLGCLVHWIACMLHWKNCPITYQGAYQGKEKFSKLGLEAITDHNLWFWHTAFGFAGSCNDLNILDVSPLHQQFLDGLHSNIDFKFTIDE